MFICIYFYSCKPHLACIFVYSFVRSYLFLKSYAFKIIKAQTRF